MTNLIVRLWLPDRPGALGEVASVIGHAGGDVVGIEILERGAARAIDELVVVLPDDVSPASLAAAIGAIDGVDVEDLRATDETEHELGMAAVELAAAIAESKTADELTAKLALHVHHVLAADWTAVTDDDRGVIASHGAVPQWPWLAAYLEGVRHVAFATAGHGADDMAWAELAGTTIHVAVGRSGRPLRDRERRFLTALARVSAVRWRDLHAASRGRPA